MMYPEVVKQIVSFLPSVEWTDTKIRRIGYFIDSAPGKVVKEVVVKRIVKKVIIYRDRNRVELTRLDAIADEICKYRGITRAELKSNRRSPHLVAARKAFYLRAVEEYRASYKEMGDYTNRHHTSVMDQLGVLKSRKKKKDAKKK